MGVEIDVGAHLRTRPLGRHHGAPTKSIMHDAITGAKTQILRTGGRGSWWGAGAKCSTFGELGGSANKAIVIKGRSTKGGSARSIIGQLFGNLGQETTG